MADIIPCPLAQKPIALMDGIESNNTTKRPYTGTGSESVSAAMPRPKRPKTSKACNACRKQKSRCERLAGDSEGCHRCGVIGIPCVFDSELPSTESAKTRKPRPILPRSRKADERILPRPSSPDNSGLHVLANTTEMVSRESRLPSIASASTATAQASSSRVPPVGPRITATPKTPLSPETLSTVESALFPLPRDSTSESESARFRADWRRWVAPLTLLQTLVRRNRVSDSSADANWQQANRPPDSGSLTSTEEMRLKNHFRLQYAPWLPAVRLGKSGALDDISPFLATVIFATASRTLGEISQASMEHLRSLALHHVGQVFANPAAYPLVDSLYALLILVLWPLDAADDVALLVHGAKRLASAGGRECIVVPNGDAHVSLDSTSEDNVDHARLWYAICANETILTLGAGSVSTSPAMDNLIRALGTASELALSGGCTSDVLLVLQINLHRIITAAMGERGFSSDKNAPSIPKGRESLLNYISTVHMFLTRLGEWEIEFYTISAECNASEAAYYAVIEIEYHYLCLMFATHCLLTLCHACPLASASDEIKFALWSWSITGNKSAHALIRLFNTYSQFGSHPEGEDEGPLPPLAFAPDRIFAMVVLAVMLILRHQVASYEYGRRRGLAESPPAGFTKQAENAIRRSIDRMGHIGRSKTVNGVQTTTYDHAAARYVDILEALLRIWEEKRAQKVASVAAPSANACVGDECGFHQQKNREDAGLSLPQEQVHDGGPMQMDLDLNLLGGDLFSDAAAAFTWDGLGTLDWGGTAQ